MTRDEAQAKIVGASIDVPGLLVELDRLERELKTVWAENGRLRKQVDGLREYAQHSPGCSAEHGDRYRCRCGFREFQAELGVGSEKMRWKP